MRPMRGRSVNPQWIDLESRLDDLASRARLLEQLERLQSQNYIYSESEKEEKIFKFGPKGFEIVKCSQKEEKRETERLVKERDSVDPLRYLNELISELSAVEDAEALLSGNPKATKKEDGTTDLLRSSEVST
jgi:TolA-binding protein